MKLHEWLYNIVCEICRDREYVYLSFVRNFTALMKEIYETGDIKDSGTFTVTGIKSNMNADIQWHIHHRIDYSGLNSVTVKCVIVDTVTGVRNKEYEIIFELSMGESI